jgi:hypothetical protein
MIEQFFTQPKVPIVYRKEFGRYLPAFAASLHKEAAGAACRLMLSFHRSTVTWRNSLPSADFWSTTSPSEGGSNVTPQKFSADCDRGSNGPTTAGGWMRSTSGLRASGSILQDCRLHRCDDRLPSLG